MSDMSALRTLIERVEAGKWSPFYAVTALGSDRLKTDAKRAFDGSVDAALALLEAVLPEWRLDRLRERKVGVWAARLRKRDDANAYHRKGIDPSFENFSQNPGRAILLTILKAVEARQ